MAIEKNIKQVHHRDVVENDFSSRTLKRAKLEGNEKRKKKRERKEKNQGNQKSQPEQPEQRKNTEY